MKCCLALLCCYTSSVLCVCSSQRMFLVMELCDGGEMADSLKDNKHFSEADTKTVIKRLASAISYLHKNGKHNFIWFLCMKPCWDLARLAPRDLYL